MAWILLAVFLAQASDFVVFDRCYMDVNATPVELRPHPKNVKARINADAVIMFRSISEGRGGIDCVLIETANKRGFVIGTIESVCKALGLDPEDDACRE